MVQSMHTRTKSFAMGALLLSLGAFSTGCALGTAPTAEDTAADIEARRHHTDAGTASDAGTDAAADAAALPGDGSPVVVGDSGGPSAWLYTSGNKILNGDGTTWHGRGANLADPRSCGACAGTPDANEVNRRMDELVSWGATFIRLVLENSSTSDNVSHNPAYLSQIQQIVAHAAAKPNLRIQITLWSDATFNSMGWLTNPGTIEEWKTLATTFAKEPRVLFGLVNEPESNFDHALDPQVWTLMNDAVAAIRAAETAAGGQPHIVAVQGTGAWARYLDYYVTHPITAGSGKNIAYEVHVYDAVSEFAARFTNPHKTLPVIIGEFGPVNGAMTLSDCDTLMNQAQLQEIPHLAWTFHMRCPPNLLVDNSAGGCGINMKLTPSPEWGVPFKARLGQPW